jgi:hypothetical protein
MDGMARGADLAHRDGRGAGNDVLSLDGGFGRHDIRKGWLASDVRIAGLAAHERSFYMSLWSLHAVTRERE